MENHTIGQQQRGVQGPGARPRRVVHPQGCQAAEPLVGASRSPTVADLLFAAPCLVRFVRRGGRNRLPGRASCYC